MNFKLFSTYYTFKIQPQIYAFLTLKLITQGLIHTCNYVNTQSNLKMCLIFIFNEKNKCQ